MQSDRPFIVIPADEPRQIAGSPHLDRLRPYGEVVLYEDRPLSEDEQVARVAGARALINSRGHVKWPARLLEQLPQLEMITVCGIGTDSIDLEAARRRGITVCNIPGRTAGVVAEHAFALMLALSRRTAFLTAQLRAGCWPQVMAFSLAGKRLGVIGTGNIGCEMIRLSRAFGMEVVAWSFHPSPDKARRLGFRYVELDQLLSESDVVSLHLKLTDESRHLIGRDELAKMKPSCLLVNTARGQIVDTPALVDALEQERIAGAALDVFDTEPLQPDDPLLKCEQVVLTPHSADQTPEGTDILNGGCVDNVIAFLEGKPQHVVN